MTCSLCPSVLLEPSIDMRTRTGIPTFSAKFASVLHLLREELKPDDRRLTRLHMQNCGLVLNLVQVLATRDVFNFVKNYIDDFHP